MGESRRTFASANREGCPWRVSPCALRPVIRGMFFERFHIDRESSTSETSTGKRTVAGTGRSALFPLVKNKTDRVRTSAPRDVAQQRRLPPPPVAGVRGGDDILQWRV